MAIERPILTVYGRDSCHLCEQMIEGLRRLQASFSFEVTVVDVAADPELARRYGERVPVLAHRDRELCHYALDASAVTAYLRNFR